MLHNLKCTRLQVILRQALGFRRMRHSIQGGTPEYPDVTKQQQGKTLNVKIKLYSLMLYVVYRL